MQSIISLDGKCRTKEVKNVVAMFTQGSWDSQRIDLMASELGTVERHRKFSASGFVSTALAFVGKTAAHQTTYHLEACREQYQQAFNVSISNKCFHNQVRKDTILDLAIECCNQAISAVHRKTQCYQQQLVAKDQRSLLKRIGCLDLIAVDGCQPNLPSKCTWRSLSPKCAYCLSTSPRAWPMSGSTPLCRR